MKVVCSVYGENLELYGKKLQLQKLQYRSYSLEADPCRRLQSRCLLRFRKIHRKTPVLESLLNEVANLHPTGSLEK